MSDPVTRWLVFAFEHKDGRLVALGAVDYPTAEEAITITKKLEKTVPLIAGALAVSCTVGPGSHELIDFKVLRSAGEFSLMAVINWFGDA